MQTGKSLEQKIQFTAKQKQKFSTIKIAIILPYFNDEMGMELFENTKKTLLENGVPQKNINLIRVAGALEIPFACKKALAKKPQAIIALGIVIRGETSHYELVTENCYQGLMQLQLTQTTPMIFGIQTCENIKQAQARITEKGLNKGKEAALSALLQTTL
ncbi:MAG: 6,7-dimethyl-8-ribityllumazine synthase [Patescibacteria group bacterium]